MATGLNMRMEITGDRAMFERASKAFQNPRGLMRKVGTQALNSAVGRLPSVLKSEGTIRTGRLGASLSAGGESNVFEISDLTALVGTNLPYAAQVHYGGTILPRNAKALAIPLDDRIARQGIGPREFDPSGELLRFVPVKSSPNIIGLLVMDEEEDFGGSLKFGGNGEAMYALAQWVTQEARPYLYFSDEDRRVINEELVPAWLDGR